MKTPSTRLLIASLALTTAASTGCWTSRPDTAAQSNAPSVASYGSNAAHTEKLDEAIEAGEIGTWVSAPTYFKDQSMFAIYRGPKPGEPYKASRSSFGSDVSKIKWSSYSAPSDALLNMMLIHEDSHELVFPETPHQLVEFVLLSPKPTPPAPATPPPTPTTRVTNDAGETIVVIARPPSEPPTPPTPPSQAPTLISKSSSPNVASHHPYWEVQDLTQELALGCAVIRTQGEAREDGTPTYKYHGQIWVRGLKDGKILRHGDELLEPSSWQLHPGPTPQLEIVMANRDGWPARVDLIDLNTLQIRSMPSKAQLEELGVR